MHLQLFSFGHALTHEQGLPALTSIADIHQLNHADVDRYCQGYGVPLGGQYTVRKRAIALHIGAQDLILIQVHTLNQQKYSII